MSRINRKFYRLKRSFHRHFWWFVLAACLLLLLFYGLSAFTQKPTVETITTHAPTISSNSDQMREINFQSTKKARRR